MSGSANSSGNLRMFGALLRHFREKNGVSRVDLGKEGGYSESMVTKIERGERTPSPAFIVNADRLLGAQGALIAISGEVSRSTDQFPDWFGPFAEEERKCASLHSYQTQVVPGLLQTEDYARAMFTSSRPSLDDEEIERRVAARLARQALLSRKPLPIISFVLEESILTRPLGGKQVLKGQLEQILNVGELRNVDIQVMPHDRETHAGMRGPWVLVETPEHRTFGYFEEQIDATYVSDPTKVSVLSARYGILRAQALNPEESMRLVERLAGDL